MKIERVLKLLIIAACVSLGIALQPVCAEESWRQDFDAVCGQSNEAMTLSVQELKALVEKCDRLQKVIETQDETVRKVYLKRLQLCKNLYVFVLEAKMEEHKSK